MHASSLVLFAFDCSKDWNIIFQFKIYLTKIICLGYMLPTKIFYCKVWVVHCLNCLNLLVWFWFMIVCSNYFNSGFIYNSKPQKFLIKNIILKSYIKVSNKPLCIILSQNYFIPLFKSGILISHTYSILKPYSILK